MIDMRSDSMTATAVPANGDSSVAADADGAIASRARVADAAALAEPSPFGAPSGGAARMVARIAVIAGLLVVATGAAFYFARGRSTSGTAAAHNHGAAAAADGAAPVMLDAGAARRIGVTYAGATMGTLVAEVRTVGQITYDETRQAAIAPKIEGWVDHLFVDFTGQQVEEGQPLLSIYSPMLVAAQEELLLAARLVP